LSFYLILEPLMISSVGHALKDISWQLNLPTHLM
jgi:hypothetical protein